MLAATIFFLVAAILGDGGYVEGQVTTGALVLTLVGFAALTLGGTVVYVHGMRVLHLVEEPAASAVAPGHPDKERAGE